MKDIFDPNWLLEMAVLTASWVLLRTGDRTKRRPFRIVCESALLFALFLADVPLCKFLDMLTTGMTSLVSFHVLLAVTHGVISFLYLRFTAAYLPKPRLLLWLGLFSAALSIDAITGQVSFLVSQVSDNAILIWLARWMPKLMLPMTATYLRRFSFDEYDVIPGSSFRIQLYGLGCILLLYVVEDAFFGFELAKCLTLLAAYSGMLLMTLASIRVIYIMCREQAAILELQAEKQRFMAERELAQATETTLDNLRSIRHDLKNQYAYMRILLSEKRYDDLQTYFENLSAHLPPQLTIIDCGNRAMNTILNMEAGKLHAEQIPFEHQLVVPPALPFKESHLCGIISNLLDNACEECKRLIDAGKPDVKVRIEIVPHQSYLLIKCSNTTDRTTIERTRDGVRTSKGDERMHGYGTRIVTKLAARYNGAADYTLENGMFVAKVLLDMTEGMQNENQNRAV